MADREIEIQVNVENIDALLAFLEENGQFEKEKHQVDEYFTPPHRNFIEVRPALEWLRLRKEGEKSSINYKNWHVNDEGKTNHCDEYETKIEDSEPIKKIFNALNFKTLVVVDKTRKVWNYQDYEIAVDHIEGLGDFVEIEYKGKDEKADPKKVTNEMVAFLKKVGCGKIKRNYKGYPFMLLFPEEVTYEEL